MKKFTDQSWREPERTQFWRYMKDSKVLEAIQPALTSIYELPVKPDDLYAYFAEYLENCAKLTTQISLLRAELCFKQNELEELKAQAKEAEFPGSKNVQRLKEGSDPGGSDVNFTDTELEHSSQQEQESLAQEVDCMLELMDEYRQLDPFGQLFDFDEAAEQMQQKIKIKSKGKKADGVSASAGEGKKSIVIAPGTSQAGLVHGSRAQSPSAAAALTNDEQLYAYLRTLFRFLPNFNQSASN